MSKGTECSFLSICHMSGYLSQSGRFAKWDVRTSTWAQEQPRCLRKGQSPSFSQFSFEPGGVRAPSPALAPLVPIVHFFDRAMVVLLLKPHPFPGGRVPGSEAQAGTSCVLPVAPAPASRRLCGIAGRPGTLGAGTSAEVLAAWRAALLCGLRQAVPHSGAGFLMLIGDRSRRRAQCLSHLALHLGSALCFPLLTTRQFIAWDL